MSGMAIASFELSPSPSTKIVIIHSLVCHVGSQLPQGQLKGATNCQRANDSLELGRRPGGGILAQLILLSLPAKKSASMCLSQWRSSMAFGLVWVTALKPLMFLYAKQNMLRGLGPIASPWSWIGEMPVVGVGWGALGKGMARCQRVLALDRG